MKKDAARGGNLPCAPRSFRQRCLDALAIAGIVATSCVATACAGDQGTAPADASYVAVLSGANEIPPRPTPGSGSATFEVRGGVATYQVMVANLSAPATVAHLLIGGTSSVGLVIASLPVGAATGVIANGMIDLRGAITFNNTTISGDSLRALFENGNAYVNVYTATYPGGEVRGQVRRGP